MAGWGDYKDPGYGAGDAPTAPIPAGGVQGGELETWAGIHGLTPDQIAQAQAIIGQINPNTEMPYTPAEAAAAVRFLTPEPPEPVRGFAPPAPPAFAGTAAGMQLGSQLGQAEMTLQSQLDQARNMAQQGLIGTQQMEQLQAQAQADYQRAMLGEQGAFRRGMLGEMGAGARSQLEAAGAERRTLFGEMGAGARTQLEQAGARNRALFGEMGAGARTQMETGTQRAIAAGQAMQNTFGQMGQMMASPSDYLRLAYNVQGMQPMAGTPTDIARTQMQQFMGTQAGLAGAPQQSFAGIFDPMRQTVGAGPTFQSVFTPMQESMGAAPTFGEIFDPLQENIPDLPSLQFGGKARNAAITGEKGKPELVRGENIQVTPGLSKSEIRALKAGGVGGRQFGGRVSDFTQFAPGYTPPREITTYKGGAPGQTQAQPPSGMMVTKPGQTGGWVPQTPAPAPAATTADRAATLYGDKPAMVKPAAPASTGQLPQNVFDIPQQRPGYEAPLFSGGYGRAGQGGIGGVTGLAALDPLNYSYQQVNRMLPFEQEMLAARFGESIIDPATGGIMRAGLDPTSLSEIIRRSSWLGGAPQMSRWG